MKVGDLVISKITNDLAIITKVSVYNDEFFRLSLHFLNKKPPIYYTISHAYKNLGPCPSLIKELI